MHRSIILSVALLCSGMLMAGPASEAKAGRQRRDSFRLQLALGPKQADQYVADRLDLRSIPSSDVVKVELPKEVAKAGESAEEKEPFQPHASLVRREVKEVNAYELLKKERFRIHGSVSVGVDSRGGWDTSLELHKQIAPDFSLELGISIGRWERWGMWE